jgi:hypothetical protein
MMTGQRIVIHGITQHNYQIYLIVGAAGRYLLLAACSGQQTVNIKTGSIGYHFAGGAGCKDVVLGQDSAISYAELDHKLFFAVFGNQGYVHRLCSSFFSITTRDRVQKSDFFSFDSSCYVEICLPGGAFFLECKQLAAVAAGDNRLVLGHDTDKSQTCLIHCGVDVDGLTPIYHTAADAVDHYLDVLLTLLAHQDAHLLSAAQGGMVGGGHNECAVGAGAKIKDIVTEACGTVHNGVCKMLAGNLHKRSYLLTLKNTGACGSGKQTEIPDCLVLDGGIAEGCFALDNVGIAEKHAVGHAQYKIQTAQTCVGIYEQNLFTAGAQCYRNIGAKGAFARSALA